MATSPKRCVRGQLITARLISQKRGGAREIKGRYHNNSDKYDHQFGQASSL
jgi:hypothetical protein